jgi:hypothetical protein
MLGFRKNWDTKRKVNPGSRAKFERARSNRYMPGISWEQESRRENQAQSITKNNLFQVESLSSKTLEGFKIEASRQDSETTAQPKIWHPKWMP